MLVKQQDIKEKIHIILLRDYGIDISSSTIGRVIKENKLTYLWRNHESACNFKKTIRKRKSRKRPPKIYRSNKPGKWIPNNKKEWADGDKDGVGDNADKCSDTPEGSIVDEVGCKVEVVMDPEPPKTTKKEEDCSCTSVEQKSKTPFSLFATSLIAAFAVLNRKRRRNK